ncbi:hypothetical protein [Cronobacter dublinensis]|uniref:hypothetical protein n=1 Tax=Cronobacter dublinensis TaxID=413497 RepID=UPI000CFB5C5C|nr:hypothetical protein [Cronobacter dublinensis]
MAASPEHQFIAEAIDSVLSRYATTKLLGVLEAGRKKFDYSCVLERDFHRVLSSQVLWSHTEGIHKDLMTLLHEEESYLKVYFAKDTTKHRMRIDEVISEYKKNSQTRALLKGLRIIYLPSEFDADKLSEQKLMSGLMSHLVCKDLLFGTVFGRLSSFDIRVFANHGGPLGLKYAVLDEITENGLIHNPTFKERLGYSTTSTIREVTTMLSALGLVKRLDNSVILLPTLKGRMLLDLARKLVVDNSSDETASGEFEIIKSLLFPIGSSGQFNYLKEIKESALYSANNFGRKLTVSAQSEGTKFYKTFNWDDWHEQLQMMPELKDKLFTEPDFDYVY